MIQRAIMAVRAEETGAPGALRFVCSTTRVDSYDDIVVQDWDFARYTLNPVKLWAHDSHRPAIARATAWQVEQQEGADRLVMAFVYDTKDPFAAEIYRKYTDGFLTAVSVGFIPQERQARWNLAKTDPLYAPDGFIYRKNILLEVSAVNIPANEEAVRLGAGVQARGLEARLRVLEQELLGRVPSGTNNDWFKEWK